MQAWNDLGVGDAAILQLRFTLLILTEKTLLRIHHCMSVLKCNKLKATCKMNTFSHLRACQNKYGLFLFFSGFWAMEEAPRQTASASTSSKTLVRKDLWQGEGSVHIPCTTTYFIHLQSLYNKIITYLTHTFAHATHCKTQFINLTTGLIRLQALTLSCMWLRVSDSSSSWLCKYLGCAHVNSYLQGLVQREQLFCRALVNNQSSTNGTKICTGTVSLSVHFFGSVCVSLSLM